MPTPFEVPFQVREVQKPQDFAALAALLSAADPEWPLTPELLATWDAAFDPALFRRELVAQQDDRLIGVGAASHNDFAYEPWRYSTRLTVHPDARNRGVGAALYGELLGVLQARGARELRTMLRETDAPGRAFLEKRGWQIEWRRHEFRVDTGTFDFSAADMPDLGGLRLESLDALASDPQLGERLYELDWTLFQDVPMGTALTKRPFEVWLKRELHDPTMRLGLSFALIDDRQQHALHGPYVGYTTLMHSPGGFYVIGMTGLTREYRGRGLARALKLASMRALAQQGGGEIRTLNDPPNVAMIHMNRALGFVQQPDHLRYELRLETV